MWRIAFFTLLMVMFGSVDGYAQAPVQPQYNLSTLKEMPDGSTMGYDSFLQESKVFEKKHKEKAFLDYEVKLPKTWTDTIDEDVEVGRFNPNFLTDIGRFVSPPYGDRRAFFSVQVTVLRYESFAEDWLRNQILLNGYSVNAVDVKSHNEVEALYSALEGDLTFAVRAKVLIDGNLLYFVRYALPLNYFSQRADHQKHVLDSFKLQNPRGGTIEKARRFSIVDALTFSYPSSWTVKNPNFKKLDHLTVDLYRLEQDSIILGRIGIEAIAKKEEGNDLAIHSQRIIQELEKKGVKLDGLKGKDMVEIPKAFLGGAIEVYSTYSDTTEGVEEEFWFFFLEDADYYFFFTMLTPTKEASYEEWSRNRAALTKLLYNLR